MIGINVGGGYAAHIIDGRKLYETRDTNSLRPYINRRVAIVQTGDGKAQAIGMVTIGEPLVVNEEQFRAMQHLHLVPEGGKFDIQPGGVKYLYPMVNPERIDPRPVGHGIIARKVL